MDRRTFIGTGVVLGACAARLADAQPAARVYRVGLLSSGATRSGAEFRQSNWVLAFNIPSFAISVPGDKHYHFETAAFYATLIAEYILKNPLPYDTFLNVNVPNVSKDLVRGVRLTRQGKRMYDNSIQDVFSPRGEKHYWIGGGIPYWERGEDNGHPCCRRGVCLCHADAPRSHQLQRRRVPEDAVAALQVRRSVKKYDVAIVGAGPAGIFSALELLEGNSRLKILIVEKGKDIDSRECPMAIRDISCNKCPECDIVSGWGGAGAFSDGKLNLSPDIGGHLTRYIDRDALQSLIVYVDGTWEKFGAPGEVYGGDTDTIRGLQDLASKNDLTLMPSKIRHIGTDLCRGLLGRIREKMNRSVDMLFDVSADRHP